MRNNITEPEKLYCAICGNSYEEVEDRAACEAKCIKERQEAEEKRKQFEYDEAKNASEEEIGDALSSVNKMIAEHLQRFETLSLKNNYPYLRYLFKNSVGWWF